MSRIDIIFRSIEHLVNLLYIRKMGGVLPDDIAHVISSLLKMYESDPMMTVSLNMILNFRNKWAHSSAYDCKGVGISLDLILREIDQTTTTLTLLVATTKELLETLQEEKRPQMSLEKEIGLRLDAKEFVPFSFEYSNKYQPRMISEYKETPELMAEIKGRTIKVLDGKHAGRLAEFRRFNGSVAWVLFEGETKELALTNNRRIQII
jgi:hypothetical protein